MALHGATNCLLAYGGWESPQCVMRFHPCLCGSDFSLARDKAEKQTVGILA
jgi:hypothetical protein